MNRTFYISCTYMYNKYLVEIEGKTFYILKNFCSFFTLGKYRIMLTTT